MFCGVSGDLFYVPILDDAMIWISSQKCLPLYVWENDQWLNESDGIIYKANLLKRIWEGCGREIPFPPKKCVVFVNDH